MEAAILAKDAHARDGRDRHPAGLNIGDCFTCAFAKRALANLRSQGADKGADLLAADRRSGP